MAKQSKLVCGIVMPISAIDGCDAAHWLDVKDIISSSVEDAGYKPNLVSEADDVGVIQARIVQNLYDNEIVVCDVSGKNPNVMFELGLRLAFDKPTIIIKDNKTSYMFDTGQVEHIEYPRDLRFSAITSFKELLSEKIKATVSKSKSDPKYSTFLKHFGKFKIATLEETEISGQEFLLEEMRLIRRDMRQMNSTPAYRSRNRYPTHEIDGQLDFCVAKLDDAVVDSLVDQFNSIAFVQAAKLKPLRKGHNHVQVKLMDDLPSDIVEDVEIELRGILKSHKQFR